MDERQGDETYDRLYKQGHDKQREINMNDFNEKQEELNRLYKRPNMGRDVVNPNKEYHREIPTRTALHELHSDLLSKQEYKR